MALDCTRVGWFRQGSARRGRRRRSHQDAEAGWPTCRGLIACQFGSCPFAPSEGALCPGPHPFPAHLSLKGFEHPPIVCPHVSGDRTVRPFFLSRFPWDVRQPTHGHPPRSRRGKPGRRARVPSCPPPPGEKAPPAAAPRVHLGLNVAALMGVACRHRRQVQCVLVHDCHIPFDVQTVTRWASRSPFKLVALSLPVLERVPALRETLGGSLASALSPGPRGPELRLVRGRLRSPRRGRYGGPFLPARPCL